MNVPDSHHDDSGATTWTAWLLLLDQEFSELFGIEKGKPHRFDSLHWQPTQADRTAAWKLYTELRTRITTQPLPYRSGDEATALDSAFRLFELTREIVKSHEGCHHFATLAIHVLNAQVRPFTAKWHRLQVDGRLSSADVRYLFRRELTELQKQLRRFARLLGLLAGYDKHLIEHGEDSSTQSPKVPNGMWNPVPFGITDDLLAVECAAKINAEEKTEILERRKFYGLEGNGEPNDVLGLAISGGGIRSATFALGVVQVLARKGILRCVDFLSTVSGGGYLGAFISSFLNDSTGTAHLKPDAGALPFGAEGERESAPVRHLRNHSKYLSEGGFKTFATIVAQVGYGVVVSVLLLSPLLFSVLVTLLWFTDSFKDHPIEPFTLSVFTKIVLALLGAGALLLPVIQFFARNRPLQKWWEAGCVGLAVICALFLLCEALPPLFHLVVRSVGTSVALAGAVALARCSSSS